MLRPVQKGVGRVLRAGSPNVPTVAVDQASAPSVFIVGTQLPGPPLGSPEASVVGPDAHSVAAPEVAWYFGTQWDAGRPSPLHTEAARGRGEAPAPCWHVAWHPLDGRWPIAGAMLWPAPAPPAPAPPAPPAPGASGGGEVVGRTGASRRHRRKQQTMQRRQPDAQGQAPPQPQAARATQPGGAARPGDAAEDLAGGQASVLFPPTPDVSPCPSPRRYFPGDAEPAMPGSAPTGPQVAAAPAAPFPMPWELRPAPPEAIDRGSAPPEATDRSSDGAAAWHAAPATWEAPPASACDWALARLSSRDAAEVAEAAGWVVDRAWPLAASQLGCRVVQKMLEVSGVEDQRRLMDCLRGRVREAVASPHANHVLQKCIEAMPAGELQFVLDELKGHVVTAARHRYGCRVLERMIERCPGWQTRDLVAEVLGSASQLCRHTFGNFVVQHVLEHGEVEQRRCIAGIILEDLQRLARHRVASHVVRAALVHCTAEDRQQLVSAMRADADELADLAHHHCGSFVVREMRRELRR